VNLPTLLVDHYLASGQKWTPDGPLDLEGFGVETIASYREVRTVNGMNKPTPKKPRKQSARKTAVIDFAIVVEYDPKKWDKDSLTLLLELSSRLFAANEICEEVQVLGTYTAKVFDGQN
jgi:hypothetical protein